MKKIFFLGALFFGTAMVASAQDNQDNQDNITEPQDTSYWDTGLKAIFTISQSSFSNWTAGGESTISLNTLGEFNADYNKGKTSFLNSVRLAYGFTDQESQGFRKTDDRLVMGSSFGYRFQATNPNWQWRTSLNFATQFSDGFNYPNDSVKISGFMAPAYLIVDTGLEINRGKKGQEMVKGKRLSASLSPIGLKFTIVTDDTLSAAGAYGVDPGEKVRGEFGATFRMVYKDEIIKNVRYEGGLLLFTDYQYNFGNIDVFFDNIFVLKVNDWLASTLTLNFIYDDDILIPDFDEVGNIIDEKPRLQFKQVFGLGITVSF